MIRGYPLGMSRIASSLFASSLLLVAVACGDSEGSGGSGASTSQGANGGTGGAGASTNDGGAGAGFEGGNDPGTGGGCEPPDMLIALDRTLTMHRMPDGNTPTDAPTYSSSKWWQAIVAIEALVTPELDDTIRFGLELWPKEEPGCITLAERVTETASATNPQCSDAEVLISPALDSSEAIEEVLDPQTTKICISTPTAEGLLTAAAHLDTIKTEGRDQYILLVTDGADWDFSCPEPNPLTTTQQLAAQGISTFILGFSATEDLQPNGVGAPFLNNMACAGLTAIDFDQNCMMTDAGYVAVDPEGPTIYLQANDAAGLADALQSVAGSVCCDCVPE